MTNSQNRTAEVLSNNAKVWSRRIGIDKPVLTGEELVGKMKALGYSDDNISSRWAGVFVATYNLANGFTNRQRVAHQIAFAIYQEVYHGYNSVKIIDEMDLDRSSEGFVRKEVAAAIAAYRKEKSQPSIMSHILKAARGG